MLEFTPVVDCIGCNIYDAKEDMLKTFVCITRQSVSIFGYEVKLHRNLSSLDIANIFVLIGH
jgi:hypothetical protein